MRRIRHPGMKAQLMVNPGKQTSKLRIESSHLKSVQLRTEQNSLDLEKQTCSEQ